jgi:hypothetical protein
VTNPTIEIIGSSSKFSQFHLWTLERCVRLLDEAQKNHHYDHLASFGVVFYSSVFIEGVAHEILQDCEKYSTEKTGKRIMKYHLDPNSDDRVQKLVSEYKKLRNFDTESLYRTILTACGCKPMGNPYWEDIKLLIELRNRLVHYKPMTFYFLAKHATESNEKQLHHFVKKLRSRVEKQSPPKQLQWPLPILDHALGLWALDNSLGFVNSILGSGSVIPSQILGSNAEEDSCKLHSSLLVSSNCMRLKPRSVLDLSISIYILSTCCIYMLDIKLFLSSSCILA